MSRAPKQESIPLSAAISPYGVIDFRSNVDCGVAHSDLAAAMAMHTPVAPGSVVGGPPAYLEAHGIRYVPSMEPHLGSDIPDGPGNPLFVPMSDPDRDGSSPLDSSGGAYVSPHELNSRVDDRIRRFMELQAQPDRGVRSLAAALAAQSANTTEDRLKSLRRDCEMAAQAASAGKPAMAAAAAGGVREPTQRARKDPSRDPNRHMSSQAPAVVAYGARRGGRRGDQYYYDF
jgi:hypothetical protein